MVGSIERLGLLSPSCARREPRLDRVALDLGVFHKKARAVTLPEAIGWTSVWVTLALLFNVGVYFLY